MARDGWVIDGNLSVLTSVHLEQDYVFFGPVCESGGCYHWADGWDTPGVLKRTYMVAHACMGFWSSKGLLWDLICIWYKASTFYVCLL